MTVRKFLNFMLLVLVVASPIFGGSGRVHALTQASGNSPVQTPGPSSTDGLGRDLGNGTGQMRTTTQAMRMAAAANQNLQKKGTSLTFAGIDPATAAMSPLAGGPNNSGDIPSELASMATAMAQPDYFGIPNWANSPLPQLDVNGAIIPGTGMRKFVDTLPGLCAFGANDLGQCIPLASPDKTTFAASNSDYYEIAVVEYREQMHADLPATGTKLRGYVQIVPSSYPGAVPLTTANGLTMNIVDALGNQVYGASKPHYLGPLILAVGCDSHVAGCSPRPVRIKFTNYLPTGPNGDLFIPTDNTYMGAGGGPTCADGTPATPTSTCPRAQYSQNRATLHLHGGNTPWISDGTPHQWTTPAGEVTYYSRGASVAFVPDMWFDATGALIASCAGSTTCGVGGATNDPGLGSLTFYYTNQQSGRLMFYHDHAYGITRLNVYAGEAAGYLLTDLALEDALAAANVPGTVGTTPDLTHLIPLVIQDKTFVPDNGLAGGQLALTDPTWDTVKYGGKGDLWFPHVYMPNQNPADVTGANAFGRWDYGPWFFPPQDPTTLISPPYPCSSVAYPVGSPPAFPPLMCPGIPNPSGTPEGFLDTPVINGTAYPSLTVDPTAYRFRILSAGNDRTLNLGLYVADPLSVGVTMGGSNYSLPPIVGFSGGGGSGATAVALMSNGSVTAIVFTNAGHGYSVAPNVTISGNGTGATAKAVVDPITTSLLAINITNMGSGYTSATVTVDPPLNCTSACVTATATATVTPLGTVLGIKVTNPGTGWTSNPTVTFTNAPGDTTGAGAAAIASINTEVKMVDAVPHTPSSSLPLCSDANPTSGAMLVLGLLDPIGNPLNGTGLPGGCWPSSWPTDGRDGGVPDPLTAGPPFIQIGTEGGLLPSAVVIPSTPVSFEYNRRSITVLNIWNHGLLLGPAERADVIVDFSQYAGKTLLLYNDAPAPVPAFDPRSDYYTGDPDQSWAGGAPSTLPGYGPNNRTIMQIKVKAAATGGAAVSSVTVTNGGAGYTAPSVAITGGGGTGALATATGSVDKIVLTNAGSGYVSPVIGFSGGGGSGAAAIFSSGVVSGLTLTLSGSGYSSMPTISFAGGNGSLAAATASGSVDAIGVTNGGAGYASVPTISFSGGGGAGAAASATGAVDAIAITNGGAGYSAAPGVTLSGNATANATVSVAGLTLGAAGAGYNAAPVVTIADILGGLGSGATGSATVSVAGLMLGAAGAGYSAAPAVTIADVLGGLGSGATGSATVSITGFTIVNGGTGYSAPIVSITDLGGTGTGATATATFDGTGAINSVTIVSPGSGYTAPVVNIADPTGLGAIVTTTGIVDSLTLVTAGVGYTAPAVSFSGGGGATATTTGVVDSLTLLAAGAGYTAPAVSFSGGGGAGAAATTTGVVDAINITNAGSGYTAAPSVTFASGAAAATATLKVTAIAVTAGGAGYISAPTVVFSSGAAAATATLKVTALTLVSGGSGYTSPPTVIFSSGAAAATASISPTGIQLTSGGSGYTSAPAVLITDSGGPGTGATAAATLKVTSIMVTAGGSGFTSVPAVGITDSGAGTGATAVANLVTGNVFNLAPLTAAVPGLFATTQDKIMVSEPDYPVGNGYSAQPTYVRIQDTSMNSWVGGPVGGLTLTNGGSGYASAPSVSITGGGGSGATASLTFTGAFVNGLTLTNGGAGYSSAPSISFTGGGGTGAAATLTYRGSVFNVAVTNAGSGYTSVPWVNFAGGGGSGATATALMQVGSSNVTNGGRGYTSAPAVTLAAPPTGGTQATATASVAGGAVTAITILNPGSGYLINPTVTIAPPPAGAGNRTATANSRLNIKSITVTAGGVYASTPTVVIMNPPAGGTLATAKAFISGSVISVLLTNGGSGYTSAPTVAFSGGGIPTTPAAATATILPGTVTGLTLTNGGTGYNSAPTVVFSGGGTPTTPAAANATPPLTQLQPKTIQELFTLDYGRMNATLGVELPFTNFLIQTTIPYGYVDPPTELFKDGEMQIWKITHNGVDTHFIHFHLFNVQVLNRVGWDGAIKPPDINELSWKDTVRMNPLEDVIVALRPLKQNLPWELPNSVRPLDVTEPVGSSHPMEFTNVDPTNQPATVINDVTNFGWEYVWHCHILGHEENDMMRAMSLAVAPDAPSNLTGTYHSSGPRRVTLTWTDNSINETNFTVLRATAPGGPYSTLAPKVLGANGIGSTVTFNDTTVAVNTTYFYKVVANNVVGYTRTYTAPVIGYPTLSADSAPTNPGVQVTTTGNAVIGVPFIFANGFANGFNEWAGFVGNVQITPQAAMGPNGGLQGMAAILGGGAVQAPSGEPQPAYVYDTTPEGEVNYDASFFFNPNDTNSGDDPVDIFVGLDQNGQPIFGIQYQGGNDSYHVRGWVLQNDEAVYTPWFGIEDEPHQLEVAWQSDTNGKFSLFVDRVLAGTVTGDSSAYLLDEVLLGPSMGLSASTSGTMYFDEFTSSRIIAVEDNVIYLPIMFK